MSLFSHWCKLRLDWTINLELKIQLRSRSGEACGNTLRGFGGACDYQQRNNSDKEIRNEGAWIFSLTNLGIGCYRSTTNSNFRVTWTFWKRIAASFIFTIICVVDVAVRLPESTTILRLYFSFFRRISCLHLNLPSSQRESFATCTVSTRIFAQLPLGVLEHSRTSMSDIICRFIVVCFVHIPLGKPTLFPERQKPHHTPSLPGPRSVHSIIRPLRLSGRAGLSKRYGATFQYHFLRLGAV